MSLHSKLRSIRWASVVVAAAASIALLTPSAARSYDECEDVEEPGECARYILSSKQVYVEIAGGVGQVMFMALGTNYLMNPPKFNSGYYRPTGWNTGKSADGRVWVPDHGSEWNATCNGCAGGFPLVYPKAYPHQDKITISLVRNPGPETLSTCIDASAEGCNSEGGGGGGGNPNTQYNVSDSFQFNDGGDGGGLTITCDVTDWYEWDGANLRWQYVNTTIDYCW